MRLMPRLLLPYLLLHYFRGEKTGITCAESTKLAVCQNGRISRNRVFQGLAKGGRSTMDWFFGFKLHTCSFTIRGRWWPSGLPMAAPMPASHLRP